MAKEIELEKRICSECPTPFLCRAGSRRLTCCSRCKRARAARLLREANGVQLETRQCPVCQVMFTCNSTSAMVTCGKRSCIDAWGLACRKLSMAKRRASQPSQPDKPPARGPFALERDPFVFSMTTGSPGVRTWLCPEMLPFDYHAGAVCVAGRR
jgi:hypothetical protein